MSSLRMSSEMVISIEVRWRGREEVRRRGMSKCTLVRLARSDFDRLSTLPCPVRTESTSSPLCDNRWCWSVSGATLCRHLA